MDPKTSITGGQLERIEGAFFADQDRVVLERMREHADERATLESLRTLSGITDEAILQKILALDVAPATLAAVSLIPLVEVAWADGKLDPPERDAILKAAESHGIAPDSDAHLLLEGWLARRAGDERIDAWTEYTRASMEFFTPEERATLRDQMLARSREIAQAAGGLLGFGKISSAEEDMLSRLSVAYNVPT